MVSRTQREGRGALHFEGALLPDGWQGDVRIHVDGGRITRIERGVAFHAEDERGFIALPGLPEDLEAVASQAYVEMLESGFTRVCEFHYLHHDTLGRPYADPAEMSARIVSAAEQTGIGLTLLPVFYAHGGFGGQPPGASQRRFLNTPDQFGVLFDACKRAASFLPDAIVGIAAHSLRAEIAANAPVHIHVFPARRFQAASGRWGTGSDSNVLIDAAEELRLLEYGQRLRDHGRNRLALGASVSTGCALIAGALAGGTIASGTHSRKPPGLSEGASADLVALSRECVAFAGHAGDQLLDSMSNQPEGWVRSVPLGTD